MAFLEGKLQSLRLHGRLVLTSDNNCKHKSISLPIHCPSFLFGFYLFLFPSFFILSLHFLSFSFPSQEYLDQWVVKLTRDDGLVAAIKLFTGLWSRERTQVGGEKGPRWEGRKDGGPGGGWRGGKMEGDGRRGGRMERVGGGEEGRRGVGGGEEGWRMVGGGEEGWREKWKKRRKDGGRGRRGQEAGREVGSEGEVRGLGH